MGTEVFDGVPEPPVLVAGIQQYVGHLGAVVQVTSSLVDLGSRALPRPLAGAKDPLSFGDVSLEKQVCLLCQ